MQTVPQHPWIRALAVVGVICGIGVLHFVLPDEIRLIDVYYVTQRLYYIPVVYAGFHFGWRGGFGAALLASLVYLPQIAVVWRLHPRYTINQYIEVLLFCGVGILTGLLADRERVRNKLLQETASRMARLYAELQDNFERMKRAERLSALGQLSAGLAHEIRNPLASIAGATAVLQREPDSEERRSEFLEIIQKECRRLNRLLTSFLNFARPSPPEYKTIAVDQILDSVVTLSENANRGNSIVLRQDFCVPMPSVEGDPEQLTQVLLNLALNAMQAMPEGGEILLSTRREDRHVAIEVRDQGSGVGDGDLERIFDPFFTTKGNGTGLGLAVAHQIIEQHGGMLTARRNSDRGMTFSVHLPVNRRSHS